MPRLRIGLNATTPGRVLVLTDKVGTRRQLSAYLDAQGYQVAEARSAPEAVATVDQEPPDLVLLELHDLTGLDALREIRRSARDLPIIVLTGNQDVELAKMAVRAGAADVLFKPVDGNRLNRAVASAAALVGAP